MIDHRYRHRRVSRPQSRCALSILFVAITVLRQSADVTCYSLSSAAGCSRRLDMRHNGPIQESSTRGWIIQSRRRHQMTPIGVVAQARLNVALDQPLPIDLFRGAQRSRLFGWSTGALLASIWRKAIILVALYFVYRYIIHQNMPSGVSPLDGLLQSPRQLLQRWSTQWRNSRDSSWKGVSAAVEEPVPMTLDQAKGVSAVVEEPVPMPLDQVDGWGECTLDSIQPWGRSSFDQFTFSLPQSNYVLPLSLGQTLRVCILDSDGNPIYAEFFPFFPRPTIEPGKFTLLFPHPAHGHLPAVPTTEDTVDDSYNWNDIQQARVIQALSHDRSIGDEIFIQPGGYRLEYRGQQSPVTEMVYVAFGTGIVPVLDQVRAVLSSQSTVKYVSIVWINRAVSDLDVTVDILEQELYDAYNYKLAVSCVVVDNDKHENDEPLLSVDWLSTNADVMTTVPRFHPGTMAVVSGPCVHMHQCVAFLQEVKGFAQDCICVL
jgi:hypothetical protein